MLKLDFAFFLCHLGSAKNLILQAFWVIQNRRFEKEVGVLVRWNTGNAIQEVTCLTEHLEEMKDNKLTLFVFFSFFRGSVEVKLCEECETARII